MTRDILAHLLPCAPSAYVSGTHVSGAFRVPTCHTFKYGKFIAHIIPCDVRFGVTSAEQIRA